MTRRHAMALRVIAIGAIAVGLVVLVRGIDWSKLGKELGRAKLWPLVLAAAINFVLLWGKAICWRIMLAPRYTVSTARLFRYTIAAFAGSVIAPARAGEVLRVWALKRRHGVPVADSTAVAVAEKLLDAVSMLVVVSPVLWLVPGLPPWIGWSILACAAIAIIAFVGLYIAVGRVDTESSWLARFIAGMHVLRDGKRLALSFASLVLVWAADLVMVMLCLYAVGIDQPIGAGLLILFTLNLTIAAPSTPAGIGALEVGVLLATRLLGVPDEPAFAFALIYHVLQIVPLVIAGFALELKLVLGREPAPVEAAA
jgi:uncharacterized membrane protein YbhN (UPF0104 family)